MKLSSKLVKKINNFAETYDGLKKAAKDVAEQIEDMRELTEEGAELKIANFSKKTSVMIKSFAKAVNGLKDQVDEVTVAIDDASRLADKEASVDSSITAFSRKARVVKRAFSSIDAKFSEVGEAVASALEAKATETNIKESVVPASKSADPDADVTATTTKVSAVPPTEGVVEADEGKINRAESVNFSATEYIKFSLAGAVKSFAEFAQEIEEAGDLVAEVVDVANSEPEKVDPVSPAIEAPRFDADATKKELIEAGIEAYKAGDEAKRDEVANKAAELEAEVPGAGEEVVTAIENFAAQNPKKAEESEEACPACGMAPCQCAKPAETKNFSEEVPVEQVTEEVKAEVDPQADLIKEQEALVEAGIKAFAAKDEVAVDEIAKKAQELEDRSEGAGVQVVETIENFATLFKLGFGTKSISFSGDENKEKIFCGMREAINFAADKLVAGDKWDSDALAAKCEELEQQAPGAGEIVVSTIENFNKIVNSVREKMTPDTVEKAMKEFSEAIERFVDEIPVADRTFAHKLKKSCFAALESCDAGDKDACAKFCDTVSKGLADPAVTDQKLKDFGKSLEKFCGRFAKFAAQSVTEEAPAEIVKCDTELNEVLDKMGEKGAQLDAKTSTFATKLCDSYKSMKCFTEEQLENKLKLVESLKESFGTVGVNFGEDEVKTESEVKVESPADQEGQPAVSIPSDGSEEAQKPEAKEETPKSETVPGEIGSELLNAEGSTEYDPTEISEIPTELVEEEEVSEEDKPSDGSVAIPVNFSDATKIVPSDNYEGKLSTIFDL